LEDVGEYIVETLRNERPSSSLEGSEAGAISAQLSPATFAELLPTIWLLLNLQTQSGAVDKDTDDEDDTMSDDEEPHQDGLGGLPSRLVEAIITHFGKAGRGKTLIFGFIARLTVLHTYASYSGAFSPLPCPTVLSAIRSWFLNLPRVMWDAAMKKDFRLCSSVAEYLRHVCAADDGEIISHEDMDALHAPLAVFFHIQHQTRGSIAGPYARLPPQEQGRVRALLYFLQPLDPRLRPAAEFAGAV
ncbi:rRNA processing protein, partial [Tilletia horrida]